MNTFSHPHFAEPAWLWLAAFAPLLLIALQRYAASARRKQLALLAAPEFVRELTHSHSRVWRAIKNYLLVLAVAGTGFAMARPQWGERPMDEQQLVGEDIVFALDCSRSMLAADVPPNRLERAKLSILDFVRRRGSGRVGLVAFAGQAFLQCPLTFDYGAFEDALRAVDTKTIPVPGTDIGRALEEANRAMEKGANRKLIILVTDGEDLQRDGVKTAQDLAKKGVEVFSVGVGTPAGAEIRVINERGLPELVRDSKGEIVRSHLDEATLREIAEATRGAYYPLGSLGEGLEQVRTAVKKMGVAAESARNRKLGVDRYYVPLAVALALLVIEPLLSTRRRVR